MNLNLVAKEIAKREGGKLNLSIAQIKEVLACEWKLYNLLDGVTLLELLHKQLKTGESKCKRK